MDYGELGLIIITGCARSGTSITANIINACGANMGELISLGENLQIRDRIIKPYLRDNGYDELCQDNLPDPNRIKSWPELQRTIADAIGNQEPMATKDAKYCHIWPVLHDNFPDSKWVIVRRDKEKIVDSCMRTGFMKKRNTREAWAEWVDIHLQRFDEIMTNCDAIEVWPNRAVDGDYSEYKRMVEFCGLEWNEKAEGVINPNRWHG